MKKARFTEGEKVDVAEYLRSHGNEEAADAWVAMNEQHRDKFKKSAQERKKSMSPIEDVVRRNLQALLQEEEEDRIAEPASAVPGDPRGKKAAVRRYLLSIEHTGEPMVNGAIDPTLFSMIIAKTMALPPLRVRAESAKVVWIDGNRMTWKTALDAAAEMAPEVFTFLRRNTYRAELNVNSIYETVVDKAREEEEAMALSNAGMSVMAADPCDDMSKEDCDKWKANTEKFKDNFKKKALAEMSVMAADPCDDMSEEDCAKWKANTEKFKDNFKKGALAELRREAGRLPRGLYGYTRKIQADCDSSISALTKSAKRIARETLEQDSRVASFLALHGQKADSLPARILSAAIRSIGGADGLDRQSSTQESGLYGFDSKTAELGLNACSSLRSAAWTVSSKLHSRRASSYPLLTGYLETHAKQARCMYAQLLHVSYPDAV